MLRLVGLIVLLTCAVVGCDDSGRRGSTDDEDTGSESGGDGDADTDSDTDGDGCPFACLAAEACDTAGGNTADEFSCEDTSDVCCDLTCPYECMSGAACDQVMGVIHEELSCDDTSEVCCEWGSDTDVDTDSDTDDDTDSMTDSMLCQFDCMTEILCNFIDGIIFTDYECEGSNVCCFTGVDTDTEVVCGNGFVEGDEDCDDTNATAGDGCSPECEHEYCGDGVVGSVLKLHDGFETGSLSELPWQAGEIHAFEIASDVVHKETFSVRSTNYHVVSSTAQLEVEQYTDGEVCFWYRGESQDTDYLRFLVDGIQALQTSGTHLTWTEFCHEVTSGIHLFTWQYTKDETTDSGLDRWWFDDVTFSLFFEEDCDDENDEGGDGCSVACLFEECGNEYLDVDVGEQCDDGNTEDGDGCSADCIIEECGNEIVDVGEQCDEGDLMGGDGCSAACLFEECGNGYVDVGEECDDGNLTEADGCSPACTYEYCGDDLLGTVVDVLDGFETVDLSLLGWVQGAPYAFDITSGSTHTGSYKLASNNAGMNATTATIELIAPTDGEICFWYYGESDPLGDFFQFYIDAVEQLSVGGTHTTWNEACYTTTSGTHTFMWSYAKNGFTSIGLDAFYIDDVSLTGGFVEECDDGNNTGGDGCSAVCAEEKCGNEILDPGELCDDGNTDKGDGCDSSCQIEECGNWTVDANEQCDDGNTDAGDGCSAICRFEECGNEYVDFDEECDDGNFAEADGCSPSCMLEYCGDDIVGVIFSVADGFETGSFDLLPWLPGSPGGFKVTVDNAYQGTYSMGSDNFNLPSSISTITLDAYCDGELCFWYAGQSEATYDDFMFFIDGVEMLILSGDHTTWTQSCYSVMPGDHTFEWRYIKDGSQDTGWDAFYVDDVQFTSSWVEECDDGNADSGDGCSSLCQWE